jgi:hypothetical protein
MTVIKNVYGKEVATIEGGIIRDLGGHVCSSGQLKDKSGCSVAHWDGNTLRDHMSNAIGSYQNGQFKDVRGNVLK